MKREDIKSEELEGLLVAFADGELGEPRFSEVADLISEHADLAAKVEDYMSTGDQLKDFFDTHYIDTPSDIAGQILQIADKAEASRIAAKAAASEVSGSNIIKFKVLKKIRVFSAEFSISVQTVTQMAAALTLGLFLGPSLFENKQDSGQLRSLTKSQGTGGSHLTSKTLEHSQVISVLQGDTKLKSIETTYFHPGETINSSEPFKFWIDPPVSGVLEIFEVSQDGKAISISEGAILVKKNEEFMFPLLQDEGFVPDSQSEILIRLLFESSFSKVQLDSVFFVGEN